MSKLIIFLGLVALTPPSFANEDCTADVSNYTEAYLKTRKPIFKQESKKLAKSFPSKVGKYFFEDKVELKDGTEVTYSVGGCAHYGYSFLFKGKKISRAKDAEKLARVESLLKSLELNGEDERNSLLGALAKAKKAPLSQQIPGVFMLPCGDANCEIVDKGDGELKIIYDFAL